LSGPGLSNHRAVLAAVNTAPLSRGPAARVDRLCARRKSRFAGRDGKTPPAEQKNITAPGLSPFAQNSVRLI
jgi:hypothetical protein